METNASINNAKKTGILINIIVFTFSIEGKNNAINAKMKMNNENISDKAGKNLGIIFHILILCDMMIKINNAHRKTTAQNMR